MFYQCTDVEETLKCSYCHAKFTDVIKTVHGCGEAICGFCYDDLKESLDESGEYRCLACDESHVMPKTGFTDNRGLLKLLNKKTVEKPLTDQAKLLKAQLAVVRDTLAAVHCFDGPQQVNLHCDQLESDVIVSCESAINYFNTVQKDLLKEITDYRKKCLDSFELAEFQHLSVSATSKQPESIKQKMEAITKEIEEFGKKWDDYFNSVNALATDTEIILALVQADIFKQQLNALSASTQSQAFSGKLLEFKPKLKIFEDKNYLKQLGHLFLTYKSIGGRRLLQRYSPSCWSFLSTHVKICFLSFQKS